MTRSIKSTSSKNITQKNYMKPIGRCDNIDNCRYNSVWRKCDFTYMVNVKSDKY